MFGYVSPDTPWLFKKDEVLYNAVYCGLCKSIGKRCGQCSRTALTYDMAFVSALVHNIRGEDVIIEKKRCIAHWFKRRPIARTDEISGAVGCANTLLAYYKLSDDVRDGDKRGVFRIFYSRGFKRAKKQYPDIAKVIEEQTAAQSEVEARGSSVIDEAAEPTAMMMQRLSDCVLKESATDFTRNLFYNLGKWVYLIDALDDYDKDVKKGRYNVLYNAYKKPTLKEALEVGGEEVKFVLDMVFAGIRDSLKHIKFNFNHDLTDNILLRGLPLKSRQIFYGNTKGACNEQKKS